MSNKEPREALGARDGETLLDAAKRVVRERDDANLSAKAATMAHDSIEKMVRFELSIGPEESLRAAVQRIRYERDDARAAVRALLDQMKADARRCAQAGIDYNAVRGILRDYQEGEISVSRLMELIRTAALALAKEVQL
jgi:hypothetical protein